jgi:ubiquinone/menaquinone biosynthesis C-methylase UbiE
MITTAELDAASRQCWDRGIKVLQGFRLAPTDRDHIAKLLEWMQPDPGTEWLDIGCGFGEPARLMRELRPDLRFVLVNDNPFQLEQVPPGLAAYLCDMHAMPFRDGEFDGAMFLYSLCHASPRTALAEAARVVKPGGRLFVFDYLRKHGDNALTQAHLGANFYTKEELRACASAVGWRPTRLILPPGDDAVFRSAFGDVKLYEELFAELVPVIWTATRE